MTGRLLVVVALLGLLLGAAAVWFGPASSVDELHSDESAPVPASGSGGTELTAPGTRAPAGDSAAPAVDPRVALPEPEAAEGPRGGARPWLALEGRVVDVAGVAVAGVEVRVSIRPDSIYGRPGTDGVDLARALHGLSQPGGLSVGEPRRSRRSKRSEEPTLRTGTDGRFSFRARAYDRSTLEISACHQGFAPKKDVRYWSAADGTLRVDDIVLEVGGTAIGAVVDGERHPIEGAEIRFVPVPTSLLATDGASSPRGREPEPASAPRGMGELVPSVRSGPDGTYELRHLPAGPFVLLVDKFGHLPAVTTPSSMESGLTVPCGTVVLALGAQVVGRVVDPGGDPIRDVVVAAGVSATTDGRFRRGAKASPSRGSARPRNGVATVPRQRARSSRRDVARLGPERRTTERETPEPTLQGFILRSLRRAAKTDDEGVFVLDGLPPGSLHFVFRHDEYIDEDRGPLAPAKAREFEIRMHPRLRIEGLVVSGHDGQPIEHYGIAARRIAGERTKSSEGALEGKPGKSAARRSTGARARNEESLREKRAPRREPRQPARPSPRPASRFDESLKARAKRLARERAQQAAARARELARQRKEREMMAARQQFAALLQQQEAYVRDRLGPTGQVPRSHPPCTPHADGEFLLAGLQPGTYVLDIVAPGHVSTAAGPFELVRGQRPPRLTLRVDRGTTLAGRILDQRSGEPIAGAHVELCLPPLQMPPFTGAGSRQANAQRARLRGFRNTGLHVARARSGADGSFVMSGLRPGLFQLVVRARNHREYVQPSLALSARPRSDLTVRLERGATIHGTVSNREPGRHYSVALFGPKGTTARVDPATGRYEFSSLSPGDYFALVRQSGAQDGRRERAELAARRKRGWPDLSAYEGSRLRHDIDANATELGMVRGRIYHNGRLAPGFEVRLSSESAVRQDSNRKSTARRSVRSTSQQRATADTKAGFTFDCLEPGTYLLEVSPGRGRSGRSRRGAWYRERIVVRAGQEQNRRIEVQTGDVRFRILNALTGAPVPWARVTLVRADEARGRDPKDWRRLASLERVSVRAGAGFAEDLMPGRYVYVVSGSGLVSEPMGVSVGVGETSLVVRVTPKQKTGKRKSGTRKPPDGKKKTDTPGRKGNRGKTRRS